jgi:hypothetical protein
MKRTSQALRRFGVPVLAATTLFSVGQVALGTSSALAVVASNGTVAITGDTTGTATPDSGDGSAQQTVTSTGAAASAQTITLSVTGSATFENAAQSGTNALAVATNGKTATCTTQSTAPQACNYGVLDTVSESVTVTAVNDTNTSVVAASTTSTISFASLFFNNCDTSQQQFDTNCQSQAAVGASTTYTVTYKTGGAPAAGVTVHFTTSSAIVTATQPAGTTQVNSSTANCTTPANGQCSISVLDNSVEGVDIDAVTQNTGNFPPSFAEECVDFITSTTPGRLVQLTQDPIVPDSQTNGLNMPGDVVKNTYELDTCAPNTTTGKNVCDQGVPLKGVSVALTLDHGFFTPACTSSTNVTSYANCTFNTTPAAGTKVGDLKSSGTTVTVTTDNNGRFTVFEGIAKDAGFDQSGNVIGTVTAVANSVHLTESVPSQSSTPITCGTPDPDTTQPQAGCQTGTAWTTDAQPLNGGSLAFGWITTPALSSTGTTEIQENGKSDHNIFVLNLTDQFGNLTSAGGNNVTLTASGAGRLFECTGVPAYSSTSDCLNDTDGNFSQPSGVPTYTITNANGSYKTVFSSTGGTPQDRFGIDSHGNVTDGNQTLTASWDAPITTFSAFTAATTVTPAVATYDNSKTNTVTATVKVDYYVPVPTTFTFSSTPSNSVKPGTVVTVSVTVKDQKGVGIPGETAKFFRSGPTTESGTSCSATTGQAGTNADGQGGFSFTCTNPSTQVVTVIVTDGSGNEIARSTQTIHFTGKTHISASINCTSPSKHKVTCKVHVSPKFKGLKVVFHSKGHRVGSAVTNSHGNAYLHLKGLKSHRHHSYSAHVNSSARTSSANTGSDGVTVK